MVHSLALSLQSRGHEILVVCNAKTRETFAIEGIPVATFPLIDALFGYHLPSIRENLFQISALIREFSPSVIHIHGWFECFSFFQIRILEKWKLPVCITLHGLLEQAHYRTENCMKLWKRAQAISIVSHSLAAPEPHPFTQTIYNGLPIPKTALHPLPRNRLLLIGRLTTEKCFHIPFLALQRLLPKYPDLKLTLVGDGPEYEMLFKLKESLGLPIEMLGCAPPDTVQDFLDEATLVLVPSSYESFSLVALESALRARPVIASRVLGLREVVDDQKTGLLVEPGDPNALAAAIDTLLSDPLRMEEMGKAAFERASRLFNIETTTNQYLRMYEQATYLCHHPSS